MGVDAGYVKGRLILDDSDFQDGAKRTESANKQMGISFGKLTASIFTAQAAFEVAKKAITGLTEFTKKSIKTAIDFQETQNKFKVVFGNGEKVISKADKALKNLTKDYGLSKKAAIEMLSSTGDLLTGLGFTQEQAIELSESVQELAVDLSSFQNVDATYAAEGLTKALLGETEQAKSLGIVIRQGTKEFNEQIKVLKETQGLTDMQAKAQLILQQAYEQSKNAVGDYGRTAESLANMQKQLVMQQEDISTSLGTILLPVVNQVTKGFLDGAKGINEFLSSEQNIEKIQNTIANVAAGFEVFVGAAKDIGGNIFVELKNSIKDIQSSFGNLFGDLKGNISVFDIVGGAVKIIGIAIATAIKFLKTYIQLNIDWITVLKEAGLAVIAVAKAVANPTKWKEAGEQINQIRTSFKTMADNAIENTKDIVKGVVEGFKELPESAKDNSGKYYALWDEKLKKYKYVAKQTNDEIIQNETAKVQATGQLSEAWLKKQEEVLDEFQGLQDENQKTTFKSIEAQKQEYIKYGVDTVEADKWAAKEKGQIAKDMFSEIAGYISQFASQGKEVMDAIFENVEQNLNQQLQAEQEKMDEDQARLEEERDYELDKVDAEYQEDMETLEAQKEAGLISQEDYDARKEVLERKKASKEEEIQKQMDKKIADNKKKSLEKQNEIAKRVFEAEKANKIAGIWIAWAIGVVGAWASMMQSPGGPAGIALAAVATALMTALAIASTVTAAQQQYVPLKAKGGRVEANKPVIVGDEGGYGELFIPKTEGTILPNSLSNEIMQNSGGEQKVFKIIVNVTGNTISNMMDLKGIGNYISDEIGKRLALELR